MFGPIVDRGDATPAFPIRIPLHTAPPHVDHERRLALPSHGPRPTRHQAPSDCPLRLAWLSWHPSTALHHAGPLAVPLWTSVKPKPAGSA